jgi:peptide deformylase
MANETDTLMDEIVASKKHKFPDSPADFKAEDLNLIYYPNPRLTQKSTYVPSDMDKTNLEQIVNRMFEIMEDDGVGLAAPQVGFQARMLVANIDSHNRVFIDPVIVDKNDWSTDSEGCLSFPGIFGQVRRHKKITIEYLDMDGEKRTESFKDMQARIIQHEIDHLNGKLFLIRMSKTDQFLNRKQIQGLENLFKFDFVRKEEPKSEESDAEPEAILN